MLQSRREADSLHDRMLVSVSGMRDAILAWGEAIVSQNDEIMLACTKGI